MLAKFFQISAVIAALYFVVDLVQPAVSISAAQLLALVWFPIFGVVFTYIMAGSLCFSSTVGCDVCKRTIKAEA